jgi:tetratricopeptide (TPR) repeat protein
MRRLLLILVCVLGLAAAAAAQSPAETLAEARAAYDRGDFTAAVAAFQTLLGQGLESPELYYDLGNAEFKAGQLGRAIAAYRQALRRDPQDEDIRYNLNFARSYVRQPADRSGPLARAAGKALAWFPSDTLALAALACYLALAVLGAALLLTRGRVTALRWAAAAAGVLFVLTAAWASARLWADRNQRWGVVVASQAEARNGPNASYQVGFLVPEGREVRILGREGEWVAIGLPAEGYKGWITSGDLLADD